LKKHYIEEDHIRVQLDKKHRRYKWYTYKT
jgi:hypothetical protein